MVQKMSFEFKGFIDDFSTGDEIVGTYEFVKDHYSPHEYEIVLGIGYKDLSAR